MEQSQVGGHDGEGDQQTHQQDGGADQPSRPPLRHFEPVRQQASQRHKQHITHDVHKPRRQPQPDMEAPSKGQHQPTAEEHGQQHAAPLPLVIEHGQPHQQRPKNDLHVLPNALVHRRHKLC